MDELVSIVMPAYQAERTIGAALASARAQTYPHVEIVVCNDGATDRTRDIVAGYGPDVRIVDQPNRGLPAARNAAIAAATGEYIAILDADDLLLPGFVEALMGLLRPVGGRKAFACSNFYLMSSMRITPHARWSRRHPVGAAQRLRHLEHNIATGFAIFPRRMWAELDGYAEEMRACEDYDFWSRAIFSGWEVLFEDRPLAVYRFVPGSMSSDPEHMNTYEKKMRRRLSEAFRDTMTHAERDLLDRSLARETVDWYLAKETEALAAGDVARAAALCRSAADLRPSDRSLRLKADLLTRVPGSGRAYAWRARRRVARG